MSSVSLKLLTIPVRTLEGKVFNNESLKKKVTLVTNVACECGYTSKNYRQLVELQNKYENKPLQILLFPCNQFGKQEPGSPEEIRAFVTDKGVKKDGIITMMEKVDVNGVHTHPFFAALKSITGTEKKDIAWNFGTKWIIDDDKIERHDNGIYPLDLEKILIPLIEKKSKKST